MKCATHTVSKLTLNFWQVSERVGILPHPTGRKEYIMKWFKEVFLPSLADGMRINQSRWITEKQVAVCLRYMEQDPYFCHYRIKVDGIWYFVHVMKKGYGRLTISDHL